MLSLEPEVRELRARGLVDDATAARLRAVERGELFSIGRELRALAYLGVTLLIAGLGIVVRRNLERIGPLAIIAAIALAAAACYLPAIRALRRRQPRSPVGEYVLLLGALLVALDVGFAESQFHLLDRHWTLHLLLIAALHAVSAYVFDSRLLLGASLAALTSYFGFTFSLERLFATDVDLGVAGLCASLAIAAWRAANRRAGFAATFDAFIANTALIGAVMLAADNDSRATGVALALPFAAASIAWGLRTWALSFAIYGVVYAALALWCATPNRGAASTYVWLLFVGVGAALLLAVLHRRIRGER